MVRKSPTQEKAPSSGREGGRGYHRSAPSCDRPGCQLLQDSAHQLRHGFPIAGHLPLAVCVQRMCGRLTQALCDPCWDTPYTQETQCHMYTLCKSREEAGQGRFTGRSNRHLPDPLPHHTQVTPISYNHQPCGLLGTTGPEGAMPWVASNPATQAGPPLPCWPPLGSSHSAFHIPALSLGTHRCHSEVLSNLDTLSLNHPKPH